MLADLKVIVVERRMGVWIETNKERFVEFLVLNLESSFNGELLLGLVLDSVSFSTTVIYCRAEATEAGDVYTAEVALIEPSSGYRRLATFELTVGADGKVAKKVAFGKIAVEE